MKNVLVKLQRIVNLIFWPPCCSALAFHSTDSGESRRSSQDSFHLSDSGSAGEVEECELKGRVGAGSVCVCMCSCVFSVECMKVVVVVLLMLLLSVVVIDNHVHHASIVPSSIIHIPSCAVLQSISTTRHFLRFKFSFAF